MSAEDEWLWGWDPTPGIVSVWAEPDGRAFVWRRVAGGREVVREDVRFRPWVLLASLSDLRHLGGRLRRDGEAGAGAAGAVTYRVLDGPGELRFLVSADDGRALASAILKGASRRMGRPLRNVRELGGGAVLSLPPEEQYLVASGRTYFRDLGFDDLARAQIDLETTGLDPDRDRIFLVALRDPRGETRVLEAASDGDEDEAELLRRVVAAVAEMDPDVIENHNLHGFDLPFLARRARRLGVPLGLGRAGEPGLRQRPAARGAALGRGAGTPPGPGGPSEASRTESMRRSRFTVPGRELIDTMDAVMRYDFSARDLPGHGLKAVARHFGLSGADREYVPGRRVYSVFRTDPERVRRYAADDVTEAAGVARLLGGAAFALARMAPRRYERLADAGPATGVIDPLLVRAYLRAGAALPAHEAGDGTSHSGAALHLFATGVARRVVKADVASLYPSLMRQYRIGPRRDRLGVMLALVDRLVEQRLAAKSRARALPKGSAERHTNEALSAAMKLVVNSAYGYLGASSLTRFADVHAANEVTRRGRETLALICRELSRRGVTLLEADTDGVYFAAPDGWAEADERRVVAEVASLLPPMVHLEFDGRYAAMLSHEPKNYALLPYPSPEAASPAEAAAKNHAPAASPSAEPASPAEGAAREVPGGQETRLPVLLRGVAFRSSRAEPFGESFLRRAIGCLLAGDIAGVREEYAQTVMAIRGRRLPTFEVTALVRLTKSPAHYLASRAVRRELPYEAMLAAGRSGWTPGERVRVYRVTGSRAGLLSELDDDEPTGKTAGAAGSGGASAAVDPRDYDVDYYARILRDTFAARLARALAPEDFAAVIADPEQPSLFEASLASARPILTVLPDPLGSPESREESSREEPSTPTG